MNLSIFICGAQTIKMKILANLQFLRLCKKKCEKIFILKKILYVLRLTINRLTGLRRRLLNRIVSTYISGILLPTCRFIVY